MSTLRTAARVALPLALAAACAAPLSQADLARLHEAELMTLLAYDRSDAATPAAQFDRAAYCNVEGILRENDAGRIVDASIQCEVERK